MFRNGVILAIALLFITQIFDVKCGGENGGQKKRKCKLDGIEFGKDESIPVPGQCKLATCKDPSTNDIQYKECPKYKPGKGCHLSPEDLCKPYPDCCPKVVCPPKYE